MIITTYSIYYLLLTTYYYLYYLLYYHYILLYCYYYLYRLAEDFNTSSDSWLVEEALPRPICPPLWRPYRLHRSRRNAMEVVYLIEDAATDLHNNSGRTSIIARPMAVAF